MIRACLFVVSLVVLVRGSCKPQVQWSCSDSGCSDVSCDAVCGPSCRPLDCSPLCATPPMGHPCRACEIACEPADCILNCGRNETTGEYSVADHCALEECPRCGPECADTQCVFRSCGSPLLNQYCAMIEVGHLCQTQCEHANCDWNCSAPTDCPLPTCNSTDSPTCELVGQSPACECVANEENDCSILPHYLPSPPPSPLVTHSGSTSVREINITHWVFVALSGFIVYCA